MMYVNKIERNSFAFVMNYFTKNCLIESTEKHYRYVKYRTNFIFLFVFKRVALALAVNGAINLWLEEIYDMAGH